MCRVHHRALLDAAHIVPDGEPRGEPNRKVDDIPETAVTPRYILPPGRHRAWACEERPDKPQLTGAEHLPPVHGPVQQPGITARRPMPLSIVRMPSPRFT